MNRPTESQIQSAIIDYLRMVGAVVTRANSGSIVQQKSNGTSYRIKLADAGTADILSCYQGRYIAIEVKDHKGETTLEQEVFLQSVRDAGGIAFVARSIDDVKEMLGL